MTLRDTAVQTAVDHFTVTGHVPTPSQVHMLERLYDTARHEGQHAGDGPGWTDTKVLAEQRQQLRQISDDHYRRAQAELSRFHEDLVRAEALYAERMTFVPGHQTTGQETGS